MTDQSKQVCAMLDLISAEQKDEKPGKKWET